MEKTDQSVISLVVDAFPGVEIRLVNDEGEIIYEQTGENKDDNSGD